MNIEFGEIFRAFGKGPGFMAYAFLTTIGLFVLAGLGMDVSQLTGPIAAISGPLYGGGAWKAAAEARNGNGNGAPKVQP